LGNKNERKSMDNIINNSIIQKVTTKRFAIYKAIGMLPQPEFKDKFKKETLCQQNENTPKQSLEKCLNVIEPNKEKKVNDYERHKDSERTRKLADYYQSKIKRENEKKGIL
jgi:hypothetical protein